VSQKSSSLHCGSDLHQEAPVSAGKLLPLGIALCIPTKDKLLKKLLLVFDHSSMHLAVEISNFLWSALMMKVSTQLCMSENELSDLGIVLDVAGPGQHVPEYERKIQNHKGRELINQTSLLERLILQRQDRCCLMFFIS
jgi:hypothetical protein